MIKTSACVLFLLVLVSSQATQYEYGYSAGVFATQSQNHILQSSREVGRSLDIRVRFTEFFSVLPKVAIATSLIDMEAGTPSGYAAEITDVSHKGFIIRVTALSEKQINSIAFNWMATSDPHIFVEYVDTRELSSLNEGSHQYVMSVPLLGWDHEDKPTAASYLIGAQFGAGSTVSLQQQVSNVFANSVDITFSSQGETPVLGASVCLVFTTNKIAFNSGELGLRVDSTHPWVSRSEQKLVNVEVSFDIPMDLPQGQRSFFSGLTGFEANVAEANLRINVQDMHDLGEQGQLSYGTWANSQLTELGFNAFVFRKSDVRLYGELCAVVYSEPNLQGDSFAICAQSESNTFDGKIKSFYIPPGGSLTLFSGKSMQTFTETHDHFDAHRAFHLISEEHAFGEEHDQNSEVRGEESANLEVAGEEAIEVGVAEESYQVASEESFPVASEEQPFQVPSEEQHLQVASEESFQVPDAQQVTSEEQFAVASEEQYQVAAEESYYVASEEIYQVASEESYQVAASEEFNQATIGEEQFFSTDGEGEYTYYYDYAEENQEDGFNQQGVSGEEALEYEENQPVAQFSEEAVQVGYSNSEEQNYSVGEEGGEPQFGGESYEDYVYTYDFEESQEIIQETEENIDYLKLLVEDD